MCICAQLYYICIIRVLDGIVGLQWAAVIGRGTKKLENHFARKKGVHVDVESVRPLPVFDIGTRLKLKCTVPGIDERNQ